MPTGKLKRELCSTCGYPATTCVCRAVSPFSTLTRVDILQHPSEVHVAKNTARLCKLCLPELNIWIGENAEDFLTVRQSLEEDSAKILVLYLDDSAVELTTIATGHQQLGAFRIVLIDGTWKKAFKMWQLNPWLHSFTTVKFTDRTSSYDIRKSPNVNALSTLEALAYSLELLEPLAPVKTLYDTFAAMQAPFKKFSPSRP